MSYFGYVERAADSYINWADVGRNMSETIDNVLQARQEKRDAIETAFNEDMEYIKAQVSGENRDLRQWNMDFANNAAEMYKLRYNMLKSGQINVKDFTSFRENLVGGTETLYSVLADVQTRWSEAIERHKNGDSQMFEMMQYEQLERFGNLQNTEAYINDLNGSLAIGLTEEVEIDGKKVRRLKKDPNAYVTVGELKAAANMKFDNFDPMPELKAWVDSHGDVVDTLRMIGAATKSGAILKVTDITGNKYVEKLKQAGIEDDELKNAIAAVEQFKDAKNEFYGSILAKDFDALAIATDQKKFAPNGKQYTPTYNPKDLEGEKKDVEHFILMERVNGIPKPKFTDDQRDDLIDYLDKLATPMFDRKSELSTYAEQRPQQGRGLNESERKAGASKKTVQQFGDIIRKIISSDDPRERDASMETLKQMKGIDGNNTYFDAETGEIVVTPMSPNAPVLRNKVLRKNANGDWVSNVGGDGYYNDITFAGIVFPMLEEVDAEPGDIYEFINMTPAQESKILEMPIEGALEKINALYEEALNNFPTDMFNTKQYFDRLDKLDKRRKDLIDKVNSKRTGKLNATERKGNKK